MQSRLARDLQSLTGSNDPRIIKIPPQLAQSLFLGCHGLLPETWSPHHEQRTHNGNGYNADPSDSISR